MLFHAHVPASYWVDAFISAVYIINRIPTKVLQDHSPYELLYSMIPNYTNMRTFGCLVYPYLRDYSAHKLAPCSIPCIFIGYNNQYKGYKCLDPTTSRVYITRHARFDEATFPFFRTAAQNAISTLELTSFLDDNLVAESATDPTHIAPPAHTTSPQSRDLQPIFQPHSPCGLCPHTTVVTATGPSADAQPNSPHPDDDYNDEGPSLSDNDDPPSPPSPVHRPPVNPPSTHPMQTRLKSGIVLKKHNPDFLSLLSHQLHVALLSDATLKGYKTAAKHPHWMAAMRDEMEALIQNRTWVLVPRPHASNVVGSKEQNFNLIVLLSDSKHGLSLKVLPKFRAWIIHTLSVWLSSHPPFELYFHLLFSISGVFTN